MKRDDSNLQNTSNAVKAKRIKVGIIGTGMLGSAIAIKLAKNTKMYDVAVYNRTTQKTKAAKTAGARVLKTPAAVAKRSDVIIIVLKDENVVQSVSFEKDSKNTIISGIQHKNNKPVIIDMSTINPADSKEITAQYKKHGIVKIDVPVMGGPDAVSAGNLVAMVSGDKKAFESYKIVLDEISQEILFLDKEPGVANTVKLAMNMQITMLALSLAEGITLVGKSGINPRIFLDVLNTTYFSTGMSRKKAYSMIDKNQKPTFTLANLRKDIKIMTKVATTLELDLPMIRMAEKVYSNALKDGHGQLDYTGIIRHIEKSDLSLRQGET